MADLLADPFGRARVPAALRETTTAVCHGPRKQYVRNPFVRRCKPSESGAVPVAVAVAGALQAPALCWVCRRCVDATPSTPTVSISTKEGMPTIGPTPSLRR